VNGNFFEKPVAFVLLAWEMIGVYSNMFLFEIEFSALFAKGTLDDAAYEPETGGS